MRYLIIIFLILFQSCINIHKYELPEQAPTFDELGIPTEQFNTLEKITIYVETNIETIIKDQDCGIMPWDAMYYQKADILDKCILVAWMCLEAELFEDIIIILGGQRYSERTWYVVDELGNPIFNYQDSYLNIYQRRSLNSLLYDYSQKPCIMFRIGGDNMKHEKNY